ncbi:MAG: hypothetical protein ACLQOO_01900 [Terriglobia bacterium]
MTQESVLQSNPFAVQTPEDISAEETVELFVDVFSDFYNIPNPGHTFVHGPRGSGKSMMFRYLEPDCQQVKHQQPLENLPFYAVYVPIKNTDLKLTELARLEDKHANYVLNEHMLVVYIGSLVFRSLLKRASITDADGRYAQSIRTYFDEVFRKLLAKSDWPECRHLVEPGAPANQYFQAMTDEFDELYTQVSKYLKKLAFRRRPLPYAGALCGYLDFMMPLLRQLRVLPFMPRGPIFLLLDDADNLNEAQTRILNSWVFCRTSSEVSLKISTQLNYKTYRTATDQRIESPHDYSEVNISSVYASEKSRYSERITEIVKKRLKRSQVPKTPQEFFPEYDKQEAAIKEIAQAYIDHWKESGRGHRARDDAYRYARPDYIKGLGGQKKATSKYRYAGFEQLVYLSSGVIRFFLDPASKMHAEVWSAMHGKPVEFIDSAIQDQVVRDEADRFMEADFEKMVKDEVAKDPTRLTKLEKLQNLIHALGGGFRKMLLSDASERRVFSVAFSDAPSLDVLDVFRLGVQYAYFHESSIGNKEGTGRTKLFILSRRLAPFFSLDPTGFAGYKFITNERIREAMARPKAFVDKVSKNPDEVFEDPPQLSLFEGQE